MYSAAWIIVLLSVVISVSDGSTHQQLIQKRAVVAGCTLTPEIEEGPYYYNGSMVRKNITESQVGIPFTLTITVIDTNNCSAIINAAVDLWQCNSIGNYSHYETSTISTTTYLRGIQLTNSSGQVTFNTLYPGYYSGRTTHIHTKVRFGGVETSTGSIYYWGGHTSYTGQIFFNDSYTTLVEATTPYSSNTIARTLNSVDRVYTQQDGVDALATLTYVNQASGVAGGLIGTIIVKVDSTVGASSSSSASTTTAKASTKASTTTAKASTKAPTTTAKASTKASTTTAKASTKAPTTTAKASTKVPTTTAKASTKVPTTTAKASTKASTTTAKKTQKDGEHP